MDRPSPGRKKSIKFRLPGFIVRVLAPLPTWVKKGDAAATQRQTPTAVVFISRPTAMGIMSGVIRSAVDVLVMMFVKRNVTI